MGEKSKTAAKGAGRVKLRPFPYPYQAALAISNDIDNATPELFSAVHTALNTEKETPLGTGLGLEITDTLWCWGGGVHLLDEKNQFTPQARRLAELAHQGWLDALHGLGDFNGRGGCTRDLAKIAYAALDDLEIQLSVFINHGDSYNAQNFFCRRDPQYRGDDPGAPQYHADLAYEHGIRWFWCNELVAHPLSAQRQDPLQRQLRRFSLHSKNLIKKLIGRARTRRPLAGIEALAHAHRLRDGHRMWNFTRYSRHPEGMWHRPGRHTFKEQLSPQFFDDLLEQQGWAVLYTHFGQPKWRRGEPLFDQENWQALQRVSRLWQEDKLLVAGTRRLLDLWRRQHYLVWETTEADDRQIVDIQYIDCPVEGHLQLTPEDCHGVAFESQANKAIELRLNGESLAGTRPFKGTEPGNLLGSYIPWQPLQLPPMGFALGDDILAD